MIKIIFMARNLAEYRISLNFLIIVDNIVIDFYQMKKILFGKLLKNKFYQTKKNSINQRLPRFYKTLILTPLL